MLKGSGNSWFVRLYSGIRRKLEMKAFICIPFLLVLLYSCTADANDYCYRASLTTNQPTSGDASSRENEVEAAVRNMLNELGNDTNLGFTTNDRNQTLEAVLGDSSTTEFQVLICFQNSSKTQDEFTQILVDFNFTTQIDSSAVSAGDFDECGGNYTTNCHEFANCNNNNGSFACVCLDEYFDRSANNATGEDCVLPTNHTCETNGVEVSAYYPYFSALGISETELKVGDCNGTLMGDNLIFSGVCSPSLQDNGTHIIYTWNLTNIDSTAEVTIGNYVHIPVICASPSNGTANFTFNGTEAEAAEFGQDLFIDLSAAALQIQVQAFSDTAFLNAFTEGGRIQTNQDLAFRMGPTDGFISDNIKTVCQGLQSGPAEGFTDPSYLIRDGCKVSDPSLQSLLDTLDILEQGTGAEASISLSAHFYSNSQQTQLGFEVYTCLESGGSSCQPSCNSRRKRSIVNVRVKRQSALASGVRYFVFQRDSNDVCTRDCGVGICIVDPTRKEQCACSQENTYKDEAGRCLPIKDLESSNNEATITTAIIALIAIVSVLFLIVVSVALGCLYWQKKKQRNKKVANDF